MGRLLPGRVWVSARALAARERFGNHLVFCTAAGDIGTVDQGEGSVHGVILQ